MTLDIDSGPEVEQDLARSFQLSSEPGTALRLLNRRIVRLRVPANQTTEEALTALGRDARVLAAQPNYVYSAIGGPAAAAAQYTPAKLHLDAAHAITKGEHATVALIDTAVDLKHPSLQGSITDVFDAIGTNPSSPEAHGTAIAGIIAAHTGLESVAPAATLLSVRAFRSEAEGGAKSDTLAIIKGLDWAASHGAHVFNLSFAGPPEQLLSDTVATLVNRGDILIAAAGNGGPEAPPAYPGAYPGVIAITATDSDDKLYKSANRGAYIALAAPGVDVLGPEPGGGFGFSSGTSMAAAHVSGIAALMLGVNSTLTGETVRAALTTSATKLGGDTDLGAGLADAAAALRSVPHR